MKAQFPFMFNAVVPGILSAASGCTDLRIPVSVDRTLANDIQIQTHNLDVLYALADREILVSAEYELSARLCLPDTESETNSDTLQVLLHGATFNKNMWDIQRNREEYSYVHKMNSEGYATLAVDLVGYGNSTFPDGLREAHTQTYIETTHRLIQKIKAGEIGGRAWSKVAVVGFSIGAITANSLAEQYPNDADAIVLHGITWDMAWLYPAFLFGLQAPAAQIDPGKWGHLDPTYMTQSTYDGRRVMCFVGNYEEEMLQYDWETRDFDTLGAAISLTYHLVVAPQYTGPVFLGIGDQDATFCGGRVCREQPYALYKIFPNANAHDIKVYPETGHLILYHRTGPQLISDTLSFLKNSGF